MCKVCQEENGHLVILGLFECAVRFHFKILEYSPGNTQPPSAHHEEDRDVFVPLPLNALP